MNCIISVREQGQLAVVIYLFMPLTIREIFNQDLLVILKIFKGIIIFIYNLVVPATKLVDICYNILFYYCGPYIYNYGLKIFGKRLFKMITNKTTFSGVQWKKLFIKPEDRYWSDIEERRVILLFDLDSFEVQVYQDPSQIGYARVVTCSNGRIISVSREAKRLGITRNSTPFFKDAIKLCPSLIRINQPTIGTNNRPDKTFARDATIEVVKTIQDYLNKLEPRPIFEFSTDDEFYVDITEFVDYKRNLWFNTPVWPKSKIYSTFVNINYNRQKIELKKRFDEIDRDSLEWQDVRLAYGAKIGTKILKAIQESTTFECSLGVGSNKLVAKMACGINKPFGIAVITPSGFKNFCDNNLFTVIPGLGGKTGNWLEENIGECNISNFQKEPHKKLSTLISRYYYENQNTHQEDVNEFVRAARLLNSAFGICTKKVISKNTHGGVSVNNKLNGKCFNKDDLHKLLKEESEYLFRKIEQDRRLEKRVVRSITLSIDADGYFQEYNIQGVFEVEKSAEINGSIIYEHLREYLGEVPRRTEIPFNEIRMSTIFYQYSQMYKNLMSISKIAYRIYYRAKYISSYYKYHLFFILFVIAYNSVPNKN